MFKEAALSGKKVIIGLVHLHPLLGTPYYKEGDMQKSIDKALHDAEALMKGGADGCLIQSVDKIYSAEDDTDYGRVAALAAITDRVRQMTGPDFFIGAQLMWNNITPSLAVCKAAGANFTRCSCLVGSTQSNYGLVNANPLKVAEYRNKIGAHDVEMLSEISGYHHTGTYDKAGLMALVSASMNAGASAVEIMAKDEELNNRMCQDIKSVNKNIPIILGGGTDVENCKRRLQYADGALVGSCFEDGKWGGPINWETVKAYVQNVRELEK